LPVVAGLLLLPGCAGGGGDPLSAESMQTRLDNQARAVAALSTENQKLLARIRELQARNEQLVEENDRLRKQR
jgi:hypothetical protein